MKNITPLNQKNNAHGYWEWYYTNGSVMYKCFYYNGKRVGYSEWNFNNELSNKTYYI